MQVGLDVCVWFDMGGSKYVGVEGFQQGKNFPYIHMTKAP